MTGTKTIQKEYVTSQRQLHRLNARSRPHFDNIDRGGEEQSPTSASISTH
jgi:hypothetical protein